MNDRRVAILGDGMYRPDKGRYENAEEGVAMAYRQLLDNIRDLDPQEINIKSGRYDLILVVG
ncbi:MAG: hypothetical protein A2Y59_01765 [Chloroflexi bacterium RBG_13_52_14]|nr:MAG: hypothetical protein A2Y59_01765 [Chloroflexi bacterium RBG_13_52_14]